jgi:hypothetical protein
MAVPAVTIRSEAWCPMLGTPMLLMSKFHKRIHTILSSNDDASTSSTVTSVWTAAWDVLFATKSHAAVASTTSDDFDFDTINKHFRTLVAGDNQPKNNAKDRFKAGKNEKGANEFTPL